MDDVKFYRCFPTTLGQFSYYPDDTETNDMIYHISARKKIMGFTLEMIYIQYPILTIFERKY